MHNDGETEVGIAVVDDQVALVADEDGEVVVTPLFQDVVAEVVVVATLVVDLYDVVRDDVLKDLVRADVDQVVVGDVNERLFADELFVVVLSDADLDVSHVDFVVNSLSLTLVDEFSAVDADLYVSHLVDIVVANLYVVAVNLYVVNILVVELYLFVVDELSLFVVD